MTTKKDLVIVILATFCLTLTLFTILPTHSSSSTAALEYDPWIDINDDGIIDILDIRSVAIAFGIYGDPINKTALLYEVNATFTELQSKIDSLNASLLDLEAYFETRIDTLNATLAEQQSRIADLETQLIILNATKLGKPDYDSGWISINKGDTATLYHNLTTTNVLVYLVGKYSNYSTPYIHQKDYGSTVSGLNRYGAVWHDLTETSIKVDRESTDSNWQEIRVMIWKIPQ